MYGAKCSDKMKPGAKFFEWERRGVPLRLECGPRDADANKVVVAKRTGGDKEVPHIQYL